MQLRLRTYTLREGLEHEFIERWNDTLVPLRREVGFKVMGGWFAPERRQFTWLVGWPGPGSYDQAEQAYYDSPLRATIGLDASDYIESVDVVVVEDVLPGS